MKTPEAFVKALSELKIRDTFNPYRDICPKHDLPDAAFIRRSNLLQCLEAAIEARTDTIWVARDLGYRGGRRTGVPLTDEAHLGDAEQMFGGVSLSRATCGQAMAERTATVTWSLLSEIRRPVMLWNVFPLHPHASNDPMTNRCHKKSEREITWHFLTSLVDMIKPNRIVGIGRDAGKALADLQTPVETVRHPSYGGQADFIRGIRDIYSLEDNSAQQSFPLFPFLALS